MLRHLKNANELILYASISCGAAFVGRLFPAFWMPIMLLRIGVFSYCIWIVVLGEDNKILAGIIGSAVLIGLIGGYWDYIDVILRFNPESISRTITIVACTLIAVAGIAIQVRSADGKTSKK